MAKRRGLPRVYVHCFLDGRDVGPKTGAGYVKMLQDECEKLGNCKIATIQGRFWGMDRDKRWERLQKGYDAIVRGTTSARTIRLLREAGAAEVHYRISAPPFAHPCYFGTDIPDEKDLIATGHTVEEINELVGSDTLGYLSIEHVQQLAIHSKCGFCTGCFTGKYPVAPPTETMDIVYDKPLSQSKTNKKL